MVNNSLSAYAQKIKSLMGHQKKSLSFLLIACVLTFGYLKPQLFADIWLTRDQQGQLLFNLGHYQQASKLFNETKWQAYSAYANEDFKQAALLFGQYQTANEKLAQANALAQAEEYLAARDLYQHILEQAPDKLNQQAAKTNLTLVQGIIDEINLLSESQKPEQGESIKELGDKPKKADGADKKEAQQPAKKQLTAEQLLLDPKLNAMWLRQVQKDPGNFLAQKFYQQSQAAKKQIQKQSDKASAITPEVTND